MYQINLRAHASKLASLATRWQIARIQRPAVPRRAIQLHVALAALSRLVTLRVMPGWLPDSATRPDPRDPRNW
jgi:hypothetical protein